MGPRPEERPRRSQGGRDVNRAASESEPGHLRTSQTEEDGGGEAQSLPLGTDFRCWLCGQPGLEVGEAAYLSSF